MTTRKLVFVLASLFIWLVGTAPAQSHELQPGYLQIDALSPESYRVFFRAPDVRGTPMSIDAVLPESCVPRRGPPPRFDERAWVSAWVATCPGGFAGGTLVIEGLGQQRTDVLLRYPGSEGTPRSKRLTPADASYLIPSDPGSFEVLRTYLWLGFDHILAGLDHLLFVFALLLLVPSFGQLVGTITAFTVAHSLTLAGVTLGWFSLPSAPVEAVIALSIMFVAAEILTKSDAAPTLAQRNPWMISFAFGLLHGFGFAGALEEIGLPQGDVPLALLSFNVGVELGQLTFVFVLVAAGYILRRLWRGTGTQYERPVITLAVYGIGSIAAYWFVERVLGFLPVA